MAVCADAAQREGELAGQLAERVRELAEMEECMGYLQVGAIIFLTNRLGHLGQRSGPLCAGMGEIWETWDLLVITSHACPCTRMCLTHQ